LIKKLQLKIPDEEQYKEEITDQYRLAFLKIKELFIEGEADAPCERLQDPNDKITCMVLWILSIEPGFYTELNVAVSEVIDDLVEYFGPLARAITAILQSAEKNRTDKILKGSEVEFNDQELGTFRGSLILFRGARMETNWIAQW